MELNFKAKQDSRLISIAHIEDIRETNYNFLLKKKRIIDRIFYICKTIAKHFKIKTHSVWNLDEYDINELNLNDFIDYDNNDVVSFGNDLFIINGDDSYKALIKKTEWEFNTGEFPVRWLFENFEDELKLGIKQYKDILKKQEEEDRKEEEDLKKRKKKRNDLIAKIKSKLTDEEIKVLFPNNF